MNRTIGSLSTEQTTRGCGSDCPLRTIFAAFHAGSKRYRGGDRPSGTNTGAPFTAHTTNPVPFILVNYEEGVTLREGGVLADIVPTLIDIMGMEQPKEMTGKSLLVR